MNLPTTSVCRPQALDETQRAALFALYETYYGGTSYALFCRDLLEKDHILLLHDADSGAVCGFTTLKVLHAEHENRPVRALFSGDTIIARPYWGSQALPWAWCALAGRIYAAAPHIALYWLLIVKGDRTYRYLNVFSKSYHPSRKTPTPPDMRRLADFLAAERFGGYYDPERGIVHYPQSQGHLKTEWHNPAATHNPEARFFAERNPNYAQGDELVCLTLLHPDNLKSFALKGFQAGVAQGVL